MVEAAEAVAAALRRRDNGSAARVHLHVAAERADRVLLVREVVLVEARAANTFGVIDPFGHDARLVLHAEHFIRGLLAFVTAADVKPLHTDAWRFGKRAPHVGGVRDRGQLFAFEAGPDLGRRDIDDR